MKKGVLIFITVVSIVFGAYNIFKFVSFNYLGSTGAQMTETALNEMGVYGTDVAETIVSNTNKVSMKSLYIAVICIIIAGACIYTLVNMKKSDVVNDVTVLDPAKKYIEEQINNAFNPETTKESKENSEEANKVTPVIPRNLTFNEDGVIGTINLENVDNNDENK